VKGGDRAKVLLSSIWISDWQQSRECRGYHRYSWIKVLWCLHLRIRTFLKLKKKLKMKTYFRVDRLMKQSLCVKWAFVQSTPTSMFFILNCPLVI